MNDSLVERKEQVMKNLWKRPEGVMGILTGLGLFGAIGYGIFKILPYLITMASNLIWLIGELFVLFVLVYILTNRNTWRNLSLIWYQINRKILGLVVDLDPISILRKGIEDMRENQDLVKEKITKLESILTGMEKKLVEYKQTFEENTIRKRKAEEKLASKKLTSNERMRYNSELTLINNEITRGSDIITRQSDRIKTSKKYLEIMKKLEVVVDFRVRDSESELRVKQEEFEQAKAQRSAMKSITSILKGGLSDTLEQELALERVNETVNESIAEMRRLIDGSDDILVNFELNTEINSSKAAQLVQQFEEGGFSIFERGDDEYESDEQRDNMRKAITSGRKRQPKLVEVEEAEIVEEPKRKYFE